MATRRSKRVNQDHITSFDHTLGPEQSERARSILKSPYRFDFIPIAGTVRERDIESALMRHMRQFLRELGAGFMFAGSQVPLEVGGNGYFLDLLFYHHWLRCFIVIELKSTEFKPEHAGKMAFYLTAVDRLVRHPDDQPSIGLILCRSRNPVVAEYAIRRLNHPIGVVEYRLD